MTDALKYEVRPSSRMSARPRPQNHYSECDIQPIDFMKAVVSIQSYQGFLRCNAIKYISRYDRKDGIKDIEKAIDYMTWLKEDIEERGMGL